MSSTYGPCSCCGKVGPLDLHHRFAQYGWRKKLYGDLIHHPKNLQLACNGCHASHASPNLEIWDELEFCEALGIEPRSKTARVKAL